jgi:diguanylate cyclase (GGDEF)-like protein
MRVASRPGDLVARHSSDTFIVLLAGAEPRLAAQIAERMREAASATLIPIGDDVRVRVTVSIGLASMPADGATPRDLLHAADQAAYVAKRSGRNRTYGRHGPVGDLNFGHPLLEQSAWHATAPPGR